MCRRPLYGLWMVALFWGCLLSAVAVPVRFATERLRDMAGAMQLSGLDTLSPASDYRSGYAYNGRPLHVVTNAWGEVSHIGYCLFDPALSLVQPSPVYHFVERYALELDLPSEYGRSLRLERDQVHVKGDWGLLSRLDGSEEFVIDCRPYVKYRLCWTRDGKELLSMSFNMECQLLTGCNTKEQESNLLRDLKRTVPYDVALPELQEGVELTVADDFYIRHGGNYMNDRTRNDLYFMRKGNGWKLMEDATHPSQSVVNVLLTGQTDLDPQVELTLDKYGHETETVQISWKQWVAFCRAEGCEFYFGVKDRTEDFVSGTVFATNDKMGYNHMVNVTFPLSLLKNGNGRLTGRLYAYIPLHNVSEKYFKFDYKK